MKDVGSRARTAASRARARRGRDPAGSRSRARHEPAERPPRSRSSVAAKPVIGDRAGRAERSPRPRRGGSWSSGSGGSCDVAPRNRARMRKWNGIAARKSASSERIASAATDRSCGWIGARNASRAPSALRRGGKGEKKVKRASGKRATMRLIRSPMSGRSGRLEQEPEPAPPSSRLEANRASAWSKLVGLDLQRDACARCGS